MNLFSFVSTISGNGKNGQGKTYAENKREIKKRKKQIRREILGTLKGVKP